MMYWFEHPRGRDGGSGGSTPCTTRFCTETARRLSFAMFASLVGRLLCVRNHHRCVMEGRAFPNSLKGNIMYIYFMSLCLPRISFSLSLSLSCSFSHINMCVCVKREIETERGTVTTNIGNITSAQRENFLFYYLFAEI